MDRARTPEVYIMSVPSARLPRGSVGCDVCGTIDELRLLLGESALPAGAEFNDPQLAAVEERLKVEQNAPLTQRGLIVAEGLREAGMTDVALQIAEGMPKIVASTDVSSASLLARAQIIRARVLDVQGKPAEANTAFALAEHLFNLAGRTQHIHPE
jgi:hypothetical protein